MPELLVGAATLVIITSLFAGPAAFWDFVAGMCALLVGLTALGNGLSNDDSWQLAVAACWVLAGTVWLWRYGTGRSRT